MQGLTRNPLADPGILGVNAGATFAMVVGISAPRLAGLRRALPFAFVGAAVAALARARDRLDRAATARPR